MTRMLASLLLLAACDGTDDPADTLDVSVTFDARVQGQPFACGTAYDGIGATSSTWTASDLRFYVHGLRAVSATGDDVPLELEQDGAWQVDDVALLDFEDKSGPCANGTAETNASVRGTLPAGDYTGLRFDVGVPFELNHGNVATAPSPLNLSTMFWNWQGGYKFLRLEGKSTGLPEGVILHLGSTACQTDLDGEITGCDNPNRPAVDLDGFDLEASTVVLDVASLYDGVDIDTHTVDTPAGCMSGPMDPDCGAVFDNLGLPFGSTGASTQSTFSME